MKLGADVDVDLLNESVDTDNLRMSVDDSHIEGSVQISGFDAPAIRVDLQADVIDADRLRLPIAAPAGGASRADSMQSPVEAIRALDFAGEVRVKKLTALSRTIPIPVAWITWPASRIIDSVRWGS